MFSATIKLANLQYLQAVQQLAKSNLEPMHSQPSLLKMPFYNLIVTLADIMHQFINKNTQKIRERSQNLNTSTMQNNQSFTNVNFNSFLVDYYFTKYEIKGSTEVYRQLFSMLKSWKRSIDSNQEARLFLSALTPERNTPSSIKRFLKFRKCILKTMNQKIMQELSINHEDAVTITHTLFKDDNQLKQFIIKKINEMFISLKRKYINSAKINGAVMCEFFMSCCQRYQQLDTNNLFKDAHSPSQKINFSMGKEQSRSLSTKSKNKLDSSISLRSPSQSKRYPQMYTKINMISPESRPSPEPAPFKLDNNHELKPQQSNGIADSINKYNLSFSEEFASCYSQQETFEREQQSNHTMNLPQENSSFLYLPKSTVPSKKTQKEFSSPLKERSKYEERVNRSEVKNEGGYLLPPESHQYFSSVQSGNTSGWRIQNSENESPINEVRESLLYLKEKDRKIDEKLNTFRNCSQITKVTKGTGYDSSDPEQKEPEYYPQGWQQFVQTNQRTKEKIMNQMSPGHIYNSNKKQKPFRYF